MVLEFLGPKTSNESILESALQVLVPTPSEESQPCQLIKSQGTAKGPFVLWSPFDVKPQIRGLWMKKGEFSVVGKEGF